MKPHALLFFLTSALLVAFALPSLADRSLPGGEILVELVGAFVAVVAVLTCGPPLLGIWRLIKRQPRTNSPGLAILNLLAVLVWLEISTAYWEAIIGSIGCGAIAAALFRRRRTVAADALPLTERQRRWGKIAVWLALVLIGGGCYWWLMEQKKQQDRYQRAIHEYATPEEVHEAARRMRK